MNLIGFRFKDFQRGRCTNARIGVTLAEQVNVCGTGTEIAADHDRRIHIEYGRNRKIAMVECFPFPVFRLTMHHGRQSGQTSLRRILIRISACGKINRTGDPVRLGSDIKFLQIARRGDALLFRDPFRIIETGSAPHVRGNLGLLRMKQTLEPVDPDVRRNRIAAGKEKWDSEIITNPLTPCGAK